MSEEKKERQQEARREAKEVAEMVNITFKENRKFDLHIGNEIITFRGRVSKRVPKAWVNHPDFKSVEKYFNVKGV